MVQKVLWENHVLSFFFDLSEANANLGEHHFGGVEAVGPMLEFMREIFREIINNP